MCEQAMDQNIAKYSKNTLLEYIVRVARVSTENVFPGDATGRKTTLGDIRLFER